MRISDWSSDVCSSDLDLDVASDFDIDGVKLYPGSQVTKVDVDADDKNGADKATVKLGFTSPAAPTKAEFHRRSEEHTSELQSLMRISYAVFCLNKKTTKINYTIQINTTNNRNKIIPI